MAGSERQHGEPAAPGTATSDREDVGIEDVVDQLRRERANFLNYKRRVERERAIDRELAQSTVLRALLPFLDDLDRALGLIPPELETHPWVRGTALGHGRLQTALTEMGVERIGTEGEPFDPARHEALFFDTDPTATDQRVASVVQPGYRVGDRLVRPAQVGVVGPDQRGPDQHQSASGDQESTAADDDSGQPVAARQRKGAHSATDTRAGG
jgi:molecular chaperone GrpE